MIRAFRALALCLLTSAVLAPALPAMAQSVQVGPSGLPLPRFVTLKAAKVNVRQGPGLDYDVAWIFTRPGLPVEVVQEFETWRRIRDSEGASGWVSQGLLTGKRNAVITPWEKKAVTQAIHDGPSDSSAVTAYLEPGVLGEVKECHDDWCRIVDKRFNGWIREDRLWGVYPGETFD